MLKLLNKKVVPVVVFFLSLVICFAANVQANVVETTLADFLPDWVKEGGTNAMLNRVINPNLRLRIESEINEIISARANAPEDILLPDEGKTLADWMRKFDQETGTDYVLCRGQALFSFVNLDYDNGNVFYINEFIVTDLAEDAVAFAYDFSEQREGQWDPVAFNGQLFVYPRDPDAVTYTIEDGIGKIILEPRRQGASSTYCKLTPTMGALDNSEVLIHFRVEKTGLNQYLRLWIQSDEFSSGSSFAKNGYGIALHFGRDEIVLQNRTASTTLALDEAQANLTDDWHWLRLRAEEGKVLVKLWNDAVAEPADWDIIYGLPTVNKKVMMSAANLHPSRESALYIDDVVVHSLANREKVYDYSFRLASGTEWPEDAFSFVHAHGAEFSVEGNTGKIGFDHRLDAFNAAYAKFGLNMPDVKDSDLLMRFRFAHTNGDQWLRVFVRADQFQDANSEVLNGYGVELDPFTSEMKLFKMDNKVNYLIARGSIELNDEWHWLRVLAEGENIAVKVWHEKTEEPDNWQLEGSARENISAGEALMRLLWLRGNAEVMYFSK